MGMMKTMKVVLFGATGMVGQGVVRECLLNPRVESVLSIGRSASGQQHEKLRPLMHRDFFDFSAIATELSALMPVFSAWACPRRA
jgi:putative NADH-flavin reductase